MYFIRPVIQEDIPSILEFANEAALGMRSLPKKKELIEEKVHDSINCFTGKKNPQKVPLYLFVLEGIEEQEILGCAGITEKTGLDRPLCHYLLEKVKHTSSRLRLNEDLEILRPVTEWDGPSELISLYIKKEYRNLKLAPLLSLSRLHFIASFKELFTETIIARLRGIVNLMSNNIPFWEEVGPHFCLDSSTAILEKLEEDRKRIQELLPPFPIYTSMLTERARALLMQTHESTTPAFVMLSEQGFSLTNHIDLIDAGPTIQAKKNQILTISESKVKKVCKIEEHISSNEEKVILSNLNKDFRSCMATIDTTHEELTIAPHIARLLHVNLKDSLRVMRV